MAIELRLPRMSEEMQEGTVIRWLKQEGDAVAEGEPVVEVETEKVIVEVEAPEDGVLLQIVAQEQEVVPVDGVLCVIGKPGEKADAAQAAARRKSAPPEPAPPEPPRSNVVPLVQTSPPALAPSSGEAGAAPQAVVTPLARRVAKELGIDLAQVTGSGIAGKIIMSDLQPYMSGGAGSAETAAAAAPVARAAAPMAQSPAAMARAAAPMAQRIPTAAHQDVPHTPLRGTVAKRMAESKARIPHFYMSTEIDVTACLAMRKRLNGKMSEGRISMNDIMLKAAAAALGRVPALNAAYLEGAVRLFAEAHIAFAVAIAEGLVTPVVRDCHLKGIGAIARESAALIDRAKSRRLKPEDMEGGTFTISNLGMHDVVEFSAIISPPQVGILAIARTVERAVVKNGWVLVRSMLNATLSADHRALDGVTGAEFLTAFKAVLQDPEQLLL